MGDFRADIKISFEMYGKKEKCDMWINYDPNSECEGLDQRIIDFFRSNWEKFKDKHDRIIEKAYEKEHKQQIEDVEKAELKRLQNKYLLIKGRE